MPADAFFIPSHQTTTTVCHCRSRAACSPADPVAAADALDGWSPAAVSARVPLAVAGSADVAGSAAGSADFAGAPPAAAEGSAALAHASPDVAGSAAGSADFAGASPA